MHSIGSFESEPICESEDVGAMAGAKLLLLARNFFEDCELEDVVVTSIAIVTKNFQCHVGLLSALRDV